MIPLFKLPAFKSAQPNNKLEVGNPNPNKLTVIKQEILYTSLAILTLISFQLLFSWFYFSDIGQPFRNIVFQIFSTLLITLPFFTLPF